jgi:hypothetical protein
MKRFAGWLATLGSVAIISPTSRTTREARGKHKARVERGFASEPQKASLKMI